MAESELKTMKTSAEVRPVDVLVIGAHPDDAEVGAGGVIRKYVKAGYRVGILDLTRGELGTRGSAAERESEAAQAAAILGVVIRANVALRDGEIANTVEQRKQVIPLIRVFKPKVLLIPMDEDRHPDHAAAHALSRDANYFAGLGRIAAGKEPHRARDVYGYRVYGDSTPPQLIVNISEEFEVKLEALRAYKSQFHNPEYAGAPTYVSSEVFWQSIRTRAEYWGQRIGVAHAEPLYAFGPVQVELPPGLEPSK